VLISPSKTDVDKRGVRDLGDVGFADQVRLKGRQSAAGPGKEQFQRALYVR
jgi:hypothetical protein